MPNVLNFPFDLSQLPYPTYLVGGWVRDRLLGRQSSNLDLDFVMPVGAVETASAIARQHQAGFVVLDKERQIARVVFDHATADFAQQIGDTLVEDLGRRDFCMNAIAIDCQALCEKLNGESDTATLAIDFLAMSNEDYFIDPFEGRKDLQQQRVRMIAPANLQDDPLRILRAYRQAAQLGFEIEPLTRKALSQFCRDLVKVAAERVRTELFYILAASQGSQWLSVAVKDGIFTDWLPTRILKLERFLEIDQAIALLIQTWTQLEPYFATIFSSDRPITVMTKLAALVTSATALESLALSRAEQRFCVMVLRCLPQFLAFLSTEHNPSPYAQYQLFQQAQTTFPAVVALAVASGTKIAPVSPWMQRWLDPHDPIAHPLNLVTGEELKVALELPSSPKIGELLTAIRQAQVEGVISDRRDAIGYAQKLLGEK